MNPHIAVIGAGISGLSAAWHLRKAGCDVRIYEQHARLGGHTHTHLVGDGSEQVSVDTGFIVFNDHNYPQFSAWLTELGVDSQASDMSFGVSDRVAGIEYGTQNLNAVIGNRGALLQPKFWRLWRDLRRFYRELNGGPIPDATLGEYLTEHGYSRAFIDSHIVPMCAALWSQPPGASLDLALRHVIDFMRHHRMLQIEGRPSWRVVRGGSARYLEAFQAQFSGQILLQRPVVEVTTGAGGVQVHTPREQTHFDAVVLACHSDEALTLLTNPTADQRAALAAIPYQANTVCLHSDPEFMPRNRRCWSSWNVSRQQQSYTITYWMNQLQTLACDTHYFVTLNPPSTPNTLHWRGEYRHPHFTRASLAARQRLADIGNQRLQFAGAYCGAGFHEDGFVSGQRAAMAILKGHTRHAA